MRNTFIIDAKKIKYRLDISAWRIAFFVFSKLLEFFDGYFTLIFFSNFSKNTISLFILICLFLLSFIEIYSFKACFFIFLCSYLYIILLSISYTYFKSHVIALALLVVIIALLINFIFGRITNGFYDYKSFFEDDFGSDNKNSYHVIFIILAIGFILMVYYLASLKNIKNISVICSGLISSGVIGSLIPTFLKNLIHSYRSISIMDDNGVVIKNFLNINSSTFCFWFNNDKNNSIHLRFIGWSFGSNIKKTNHQHWEISKINYYYGPLVENINNVPEYTPFEFENVKPFEMSTILFFKLDSELKEYISKAKDNICLIYMDSAGNFYAKKLLFDLTQE